MDNLDKFMFIRERALRIWLSDTNRELFEYTDGRLKGLVFDVFSNSYECRWQDQARTLMKFDDWHVSFFCSLGDWAGNITDLLSDTRYDNLSLVGEDSEKEILFRHYTRFLLVLSEMITDFIDIFRRAELPGDPRPSISKYIKGYAPNISIGDIDRLIGFINNLCKHKAKDKVHIHYHNHHLPIWFEDSGPPNPYKSSYSYKDYGNNNTPDSILIPELGDMVQVIIGCYKALDAEFKLHPQKFEKFCHENGRRVPD